MQSLQDVLLSSPHALVANIHEGYTQIYAVWGEWENDKIRRLLIGAVAGTLEALTKDQPITAHSNCFQLEGRVACNVGDAIRVSLPLSLVRSHQFITRLLT